MRVRPFLEREIRYWRGIEWWKRPPYRLQLGIAALGLLWLGQSAMLGETIDPHRLLAFAALGAFVAHAFPAVGVAGLLAGEIQSGTLPILGLSGMRSMDFVFGLFLAGLGVSAWAAMGVIPWLVVGAMNSPAGIEALGSVALVWVLLGMALNAVLAAFASLGRVFSSGVVSGAMVMVLILGQGRLEVMFQTGRLVQVPGWERMLVVSGGVTVVGLGVALVGFWWAVRGERRARTWGTHRGGRRPGQPLRARLLDRNPVEWLGAARSPWWMWGVVGVGLGSAWMQGEEPQGAELLAHACWTRAAVLMLASFQSFAQVRSDLREGTWEALLRTPITVNQYILGHWRAWARQHAATLVAVSVFPAAMVGVGIVPGGWWAAADLLVTGVVLGLADAVLASVWFLGAAVKLDSNEFYFATLLAAAIVAMAQALHLGVAQEVGASGTWRFLWLVIAAAIAALSYRIIRNEIRYQLARMSGRKKVAYDTFGDWTVGG